MKVDREKVYKKYNGRCSYCGDEMLLTQMQVDHIIPKSDFILHVKNKYKIPSFLKHLTESDVNHFDNLNPSCRICNKWKSAFDLELFRSELEQQIQRLHKTSANYRMAFKYGLVQQTHKPIIFYFEAPF